MAYHCLTKARNVGSCGALAGRVLFYFIFVSDPDAGWTRRELDAAKVSAGETARYLETCAAGEGVRLSVLRRHCLFKMRVPFVQESRAVWRERFAAASGYPSLRAMHRAVLEKYQVQQAVFIFLTRRPGRSYAMSSDLSCPDYIEGVTCHWGGGPGGRSEDAQWETGQGALLHELLHVFGAQDLYFPDQVLRAAKQYCPKSVMLRADSWEIDPLTRYLIGWHSRPAPVAQRMLRDTAGVTREDCAAALARQWTTGYICEETVNGRYEGQVQGGVRQGWGKYFFDTGAVYEGQFSGGLMEGQGTMTYPDGTVYRGQFHGGVFHGQGTLRFPSGQTQSGRFQNGKFLGPKI